LSGETQWEGCTVHSVRRQRRPVVNDPYQVTLR